MSFSTNPARQMTLDDSLFSLTARERKALENSWAKVFADELFPKIEEEPFRVLYCENNGRPNTPINVMVGASIIKEMFDYSDDDIVEGLMLDVRLQYALHTTSFGEQPLSDKSLTNFRKRCYQYERETGNDLMRTCIVSLSREIARVMRISGRTRRMDSMMVDAGIRKLSRLELIYTCISSLVIRLKKESVKGIPENLLHYADDNDFNQVFYYARNSDYAEKCLQLLADADALSDFCGGHYKDWKEYQLFARCISEQTVREGDGRRLATREDGTMDSSILQNPSDPEATFRNKAGEEHRGYVANLEESVGGNGSVVTDYQFKQNTYSDSQFLEDSLKAMEPAREQVTIATDGAYPTPGNQRLAEEKNVRIVSTNMPGKKANDFYADFELSDDGKKILACPGGAEPASCSRPYNNGQMRVAFPSARCGDCPYRAQCPAKKGKRVSAFILSIPSINRAKTQRLMRGEEGADYARLRNGVESLPSSLRRNYHMDKLPRGWLRGKLFFGLKIGALNFRKLFTYRKGLGNYAENPVIV